MDFSGFDVELILVDNNSSDDSNEIAKKTLKDTQTLPWKIVYEPTPGLANARMCGIANSRYPYILFCDDDNWLALDYLQLALPILENDKHIAVLGGKGEAVSDIEIPDWFEEVQNCYAVGPQFPQSGEVKVQRNMVYGAGMVMRRSAFESIQAAGFRFFALGRTAGNLSSGEDSELCLAFRIAGYKIWYEEKMTFKHYISPDRLTPAYCDKLKKGLVGSGFISKFYRDYLFSKAPDKLSKLFWQKEFFNVSKNILKNTLNTDKNAFNRSIQHWHFIRKQRRKYEDGVAEVLRICERLKRISKE
jgi:glycosyltransferase involved in cell wall biosynthesis